MDDDNLTNAIWTQLPQPAVFYFYGYWQLALCLFAGFALLGIWWHIGRKEKEWGMIWLSCAVFCWALSGIIEVYYAKQLESVLLNSGTNLQQFLQEIAPFNAQIESGRSILSLFNSAFILLSLPCFKHIPKPIEPIIQTPSWYFIVLFPFFISLGVNLGILAGWLTASQTPFINTLDFIYAIIITLPFLGWILWSSFEKRRLIVLAWLSLLCIGLTVIAQISKLNEDYLFKVISASVFKPMLIMLFFALALSWVKELGEYSIPSPNQIHLAFSKIKTPTGSFQHQIQLLIPPSIEGEYIKLTKSRFQLLLRFAQQLKDPDSWLEIKPKNETRPNKQYDIKDHNEIKRLVDNILDETYGKGQWRTNMERAFLKASIFEFSDDQRRKVRLRIPVENIDFGDL